MHQPVQEDIKIVRMITGEDIIGEVVLHETNSNLTINNPFRISYDIDRSGTRMGIMLNPWMFQEICSDQRFLIKDRDIVLVATPSEIMMSEYKRILKVEYNKDEARNSPEFLTEYNDDYSDDEIQEMLQSPQQDLPKKNTLH